MKDPVTISAPDEQLKKGSGAKRRRWLRWLAAAAVGLALIVVSLPVVTSGTRLAGFLAGLVSGGIQMPVQIDEAEWGWRKGIALNDVRLEAAGDTDVRLKHVTVRAGLWDLLADRSVPEVRLSDVVIDWTVPAGGSFVGAVATSRQASGATSQPAEGSSRRTLGAADVAGMPVSIGQIVLRGCQVNVHDQASGQVLTVIVPAATVELDRKTGVLKWHLSAKAGKRGEVTSEGSFVLPSLALGAADLRGNLQLVWKDLSLKVVPPAVLRRLRLTTLDGTSSGSLKAKMNADWTLGYDLAITARGVVVGRQDGRAIVLSRAAGGIAGSWGMMDQRVAVEKVWAEMPGARLSSGRPALVYDGHANHVIASHMSCNIDNAEALLGAVERLGVPLPGGLRVRGSGTVDVRAGRDGQATVGSLVFRGEGLTGGLGGYCQHEAGRPLTVRATCRLGEDGSMRLVEAGVDLAGGRVRLSGELAPAEQKGRSAEGGSVADGAVGDKTWQPGPSVVFKSGRLHFEWDDYKTLLAQSPVLSKWLGSAARVSGAGSVVVEASRDGEGFQGSVSAALSAEARAVLGKWLDKPVGEATATGSDGAGRQGV